MSLTVIYAKILSLLMSLLLALGLPTDILGNTPETPSGDMTVTFDDETPLSAAGKVSVTADKDGIYDIYWGNENGEKISAVVNGKEVAYSEFAQVEVLAGEGELEFNDFLAIPTQARTMMLYYEDTLLETEALPSCKFGTYGEEIYNFGSLSDVHFNRYDDYSDDDAVVSFPRALDFLRDCGVEIVGMPGDISNNGEKESYETFHDIVSGYTFPVYTCKGNHDCRSKYTLENWQTYINTGVYTEEKQNGVADVADNGLDFVYEYKGDAFIFFSQVYNVYILGAPLVTNDQLDWLETELEKYKDTTVYLFFHTFLGSDSLPINMCEGNLLNPVGAHYTLTYVKGNCDERRFMGLMQEYKNVVFFNGHSHWSYAMQKYNKELNISNNDGDTCTMVHVSSVSAPRTVGDYDIIETSNPGTMSEGLYITVYEDTLLIRAVDFINGEFLAYAMYNVAK